MYKWNVSEPITFGSDDTLLSPSSADTDNAEAQPNNKMGKLHRLFRQYVTKESQQEHSLLLDEMRWEHSMFTLERHKDRFFVFGGSYFCSKALDLFIFDLLHHLTNSFPNKHYIFL